MPNPTVSVRAKRVWQRLIEWYGTRLAEQYGKAPPPDWCEVIDSVDNAIVRRGLTIIRSKYAAHPPTFPQFAEALALNKTEGGDKEPTVADNLARYVTHNYGDMLTPKQLRGPWTYIGKRFAAPNAKGETVEKQGIEITGVVIDADGDSRGYRIMVTDMQAASADWGHPLAQGSVGAA